MKVTFAMMPFDSKYCNLQMSSLTVFTLALNVLEIFTFEKFDLEKVGEGHEVQHWKCSRHIANVYKGHFLHF